MAQLINVDNIQTINAELLDSQLKAIAPADCYGLTFDRDGLHIVVSDTITAQLIDTLKAVCVAHNQNDKTPAQQAAATGKLDTADMLAKADKAITNIGTKLATFQATPNLANASPLLIELAQDVTAMIKAIKFIAKQI